MRLFKLLFRSAPGLLAACVLMSIVHSASMLTAIAWATGRAGATTDAKLDVWFTVGLLGVLAATTLLLPVMTVVMSRRCVEAIRWQLVRLAEAPLSVIEEMGSSVILTSLSEDGMRLMATLPSAIGLTRAVIFLCSCLVMLAFVSAPAALIAAGLVVSIALVNLVLRRAALRYEREIMVARERVFRAFRDLFDGTKEIRSKRWIHEALLSTIRVQDARIRAGMRKSTAFTGAAESLSNVLLVLALVLAAANVGSGIGGAHATVVVLFMLIITNALALVGTLHSLTEGQVALARVERLCAAAEPAVSVRGDTPQLRTKSVAQIEFRGTTFTYPRTGFALPPFNVTLRAGEIVFVVGGNGSGKSTFVKLLAGLYKPSGGSILYDGVRADQLSGEWIDGQFACVFSDFCLFESLAGSSHELVVADVDALGLLDRVRLRDVLRPGMGVLAQARALSSGQRRRVAMLMSLLEDRAVYVFDEFTADQDAQTRDYFYDELLPELRARGKIVVVITHDTRYLDRCDQCITFERERPAVVTDHRRYASRRGGLAQ